MTYDLEQEIKNTDAIVSKVCGDKHYAQNLYAALCNNAFRKMDVLPILQDQAWSCTWRYAGGLVADIVGERDYLNYYCSGIILGDPEEAQKNERTWAPEGKVTDEIRSDLESIGWMVIEDYYDQAQ